MCRRCLKRPDPDQTVVASPTENGDFRRVRDSTSIVIDLNSIRFLGRDLNRPECVLCHRSGRLFASDWTDMGGVSVIEPDGSVYRVLASDRPTPLRPNGIALARDGFLLAHLGAEDGGVWHLDAAGRTRPVVLEVEGVPLPPTNFVHVDVENRLWVTVSTRLQPRSLGYRPDVADGFIVCVDGNGARVVADGLGYTNECFVHPDGRRLFVNETFARRLICFDIVDGALVNKKTVTEFGDGVFPDGMTFDDKGGIWITSIVSNRVIRVDPDGAQQTMIDDSEAEHLAWVEHAFQAGEMGRPHLDTVESRRLRNLSSLAFGGDDRRTGFLGCLLGESIATFRSPVAGCPPPHWDLELAWLPTPVSSASAHG